MKSIILLIVFIFFLVPHAQGRQLIDWQNITPPSGPAPSPRATGTAIFDGSRMIIFGGRGASGDVNDVWAFDFDQRAWQELTPASGPAPLPRRTPNGIFDPVNNQMIIWSGQNGGTSLNDIWAFDLTGNTWRELQPPDPKPAIRYGAASVYDPQSHSLVTFAGFTNQGRFDDTWRYDIAQNVWLDISPDGTRPLERCLHAATYDPLAHQMIIYGGQNSGALGDLWAFDLATQSWRELTPDISPPGRWFPAIAFLEHEESVIIFGGRTSAGRDDDLWQYVSFAGEWIELQQSPTAPAPREGAMAVYRPDHAELYLFGGLGDSYFNDVWLREFPTNAVDLSLFTAAASGDGVQLTWETQQETDNHGFEIERRSGNGNFSRIAFVAGHGTQTERRRYGYLDSGLAPGTYHYRLKQIDLDGRFTYHGEVSAMVAPPLRFQLLGAYPNPFNPSTRIRFALAQAGPVQLRIFDVQGRLVHARETSLLAAGTHDLAWEGTSATGTRVPSGTYLFVLQAGSATLTGKLVLVQ